MSETNRATVVEQGTSLEGTLSSTCPVMVMGRVKGQVTGPTIEVSGSGTIHGTVKATTLRSRGELSGRFEADDIELAGRVLDDTVIRAKALQVTFDGEAGMVFGACELEIGEAPDKAAAVRDANAARRPRPAEVKPPAADARPPADTKPAAADGKPAADPKPPADVKPAAADAKPATAEAKATILDAKPPAEAKPAKL